MQKYQKIALSLTITSILLVGFQNCADDLDLSEIEAASVARVSFEVTADPVENSSFTMTMNVNNIPNPTYRWEKDGQIIDGETNSTLSFASLEFSDNGLYEGVAVSADQQDVYRTGQRELYVEADPNEPLVQVIPIPSLQDNGINYLILNSSNRTTALHTQITNEFCKARFGDQAAGVSSVPTTATRLTNRYVIWFQNGTTCPLTTYDAQQGPGFCLFTRAAGALSLFYYVSMTCNRFPDYVAP